MLQFPFPPLLRPLSGTFRQNHSLNCIKKKKKVYLWTLQGVWPALEIAPRSILSVIKALKSAAGWFSQMHAALNKIRGIFTMPLIGFTAPRSLLDGASQGDVAESDGRFSIRGIFVHFIRFSARKKKKTRASNPPAPSCSNGPGPVFALLCRAGGSPPGAGGRGTPRQQRGTGASPGGEAAGVTAHGRAPRLGYLGYLGSARELQVCIPRPGCSLLDALGVPGGFGAA